MSEVASTCCGASLGPLSGFREKMTPTTKVMSMRHDPKPTDELFSWCVSEAVANHDCRKLVLLYVFSIFFVN